MSHISKAGYVSYGVVNRCPSYDMYLSEYLCCCSPESIRLLSCIIILQTPFQVFNSICMHNIIQSILRCTVYVTYISMYYACTSTTHIIAHTADWSTISHVVIAFFRTSIGIPDHPAYSLHPCCSFSNVPPFSISSPPPPILFFQI